MREEEKKSSSADRPTESALESQPQTEKAETAEKVEMGEKAMKAADSPPSTDTTDSLSSFGITLPPPVELPSDLFAGLDDILKDLSATLGEDFLSSAPPITQPIDPLAVTQELPNRQASPVKASRTKEKPPLFPRSKPKTASTSPIGSPPSGSSPASLSSTAKIPAFSRESGGELNRTDAITDSAMRSTTRPAGDSIVDLVDPVVMGTGRIPQGEIVIAEPAVENPVERPTERVAPSEPLPAEAVSERENRTSHASRTPVGEPVEQEQSEQSSQLVAQEPAPPAKRPTIRTRTHKHDSMEIKELEIDWQPEALPSELPPEEPEDARPPLSKKGKIRKAHRRRNETMEEMEENGESGEIRESREGRGSRKRRENEEALPPGKSRPPLSAFFGHPKGQSESEELFPEEREAEDGQPPVTFLEQVRYHERMRRREKTRQRRANAKRGMNATSRSYAAMTIVDIRITLLRVVLSIVLLVLGTMFKDASFALYLVAYLTTAVPTVLTIGRNLTHGHYFDEYVLIFIASLGAFFLQHHSEASIILLLHCVGKLLCNLILLAAPEIETIQLDTGNTLTAVVNMQGEKRMLPPDKIQVGDFVMIESGETIPIDGEILRGEGTVEQTLLTGETEPIPVKKGSRILAGSQYTGTLMLMRVVARYEDCALSRVQHMRSQAADHRAGLEDSVLFSMSHYLPIVLAIALLLSVVPPLFHFDTVATWVYRALIVLIVCCPAALAASVPLSFANGIGRLSQKGIQVKGSEVIEKLAELRMVIFGKTGTLTEGNMKIKQILPAENFNAQMCLALAATAEQGSTHPIARAVLSAYQGKRQKITHVEPQSGRGVKAQVGKYSLLVGNRKLMISRGVRSVPEISGTVAYIALDNHYVGAIVLEDTMRSEAPKAVEELKAQGVVRTVVLTGDTEVPTQVVAEAIGIDTTHIGLTPEEKATKMEFLLRTIPTDGTTAYVGTGDNDQEELKLADVGITTGFAHSQESIEAASVLLLSHNLQLLPDAVRISRLTYHVAMQNMLLLIGLKVILAALVIFGVATMWQAVAIDVLVTVLSVLNAARVQKAR